MQKKRRCSGDDKFGIEYLPHTQHKKKPIIAFISLFFGVIS